MISQVTQFISNRVAQIITHLRGFEESGMIGIDCVSLNTRDSLKEYGVL
jgi:hypothetical protein